MISAKVHRILSASLELSMELMAGSPMTWPPGATRALLTDVPPTSRAMTRALGVGVEGGGSFMCGGVAKRIGYVFFTTENTKFTEIFKGFSVFSVHSVVKRLGKPTQLATLCEVVGSLKVH